MRVFARSKYRAVKLDTPDGKFDSGLEYKRWLYLKALEKGKEIANLKRQIPYVLIPSQKGKDGKVLFKECKYVSDFEYDDLRTGEHIVEDTKGVVLPEFRLKQKMMYFFHGIEVKIVKRW
jgi:hypothetical protein